MSKRNERVGLSRADLLQEITGLPAGTLLNARHAAAVLDTTPAVLSNWRSQRRGPPYCGNGQFIRYELGALTDWLAMRSLEVPAYRLKRDPSAPEAAHGSSDEPARCSISSWKGS